MSKLFHKLRKIHSVLALHASVATTLKKKDKAFGFLIISTIVSEAIMFFYCVRFGSAT